MSWKSILARGLADGAAIGLLVGGIVALALGMWVLGPVLLGAVILCMAVAEKARSLQ